MSGKIVSLRQRRLRESPVTYSIEFTHDESGFYFTVYGIADTQKDRLAVARDLETASLSLQKDD